MEAAQLKKMNDLEERKNRKIKVKNYLKEWKNSNIIFPSIITDLSQHHVTEERKNDLLRIASDKILARLRKDSLNHLVKPPSLHARIDTMDDLMKYC